MSTNLRTALKALTQNRVQALLTLSGMSVGVAMVVIVSGLGRGAQLTIERQIESAGPTQISIRAGNLRPAALAQAGEQDTSGGEQAEGLVSGDDVYDPEADSAAVSVIEEVRARARAPKMTRHRTPPRPLGAAEIELLRTRIPDVRAVAGSVEGNVSLAGGAASPVRTVRVHGIDAAWPEMRGWKLAQGRLVSGREHAAAAPVALLSAAVAARLWPGSQAVGRSLGIGDATVEVVGIVDVPPADAGTSLVPNVFVPLALAQRLLGRDTYDMITVRTTSVATTTAVAKAVRDGLRVLRGLPEDTLDDFRVETQSVSAMPGMGLDPRLARSVHANVVEFEQASWEEMAKSLRAAGRTFSLLLAAAAAVSLLVGGIGVMNIMLVSVAARTREIGLRMALGARMGDVMTQFLVEAVTLAAIGGVVGLLLGAGGLLVAHYGLHWATAISPVMLGLAVAMAAVTGMLFGYGPARRAAGLDPVVALKSE